MKSPGAIRRKIKTLRHRHLKNLYKKGLERASYNCKFFNYRQVQTPNGSFRVGLCVKPGDGGDLTFCKHTDDVEECPHFELAQSKEEIKQEFERVVNNPDLVSRYYRDISVLNWVLDETSQEENSMWRRMWKRLKRQS